MPVLQQVIIKPIQKKSFPKKLYLVTTHAEETPNIILSNPTPIINTIVLYTYLGSTVEKRCGQRLVSPKNAE